MTNPKSKKLSVQKHTTNPFSEMDLPELKKELHSHQRHVVGDVLWSGFKFGGIVLAPIGVSIGLLMSQSGWTKESAITTGVGLSLMMAATFVANQTNLGKGFIHDVALCRDLNKEIRSRKDK